MSEFKKLEAECAALSSALEVPGVMPDEVGGMKQRIEAAGATLAKFTRKRDEEFDEVRLLKSYSPLPGFPLGTRN